MALNIKDTLEILKRAGLGPDDRMKSTESEQRLDERLRRLEQDPWCEDRDWNPLRASGSDPLRTAEDRIDHHKNPQDMSFQELLDIEEL